MLQCSRKKQRKTWDRHKSRVKTLWNNRLRVVKTNSHLDTCKNTYNTSVWDHYIAGWSGVCVVWESVWPGQLYYGLKEPRDTQTASLQRGLLRGVNFPDRLSASDVCVSMCSYVFFSFPPCSSISQFHLCYFHPLSFHPSSPHISVPLGELQILLEAKSILLWEQHSQQRVWAAALKLPPRLLHLTSHTHYPQYLHIHTTCIHSLNMHCQYKAPGHFFLSIFTHPQPHSPTSLWSGC